MSENETKTYKKMDTYAKTTYFVRLAQDPRVFPREDGTQDVVITFVDSSRFDNLETLWVDARVHRVQADRAKKLRKGDKLQVEGKLRFKRQGDGSMRGKIYDAFFSILDGISEREDMTAAEDVNWE